MKTHFTSDTHFSHKLMINKELLGESVRPFSSIEEMNESLIERWNNTVNSEDEVYHLGDVGLCNANELNPILNKLNGKIYLITGNHERSALDKKVIGRFEWVKDYFKLKTTIDKELKEIMLFHYPIASWNKMHWGSYMLHGHCHNSYKPEKGRILDVGVDNPLCNYAPVSLEEVVTYMKTREVISVDHHNEQTKR